MAVKNFHPVYHVVVALLSLCAASFTYHCGMLGFRGADQSLLLDVAYRVHLGQHPYTDFFTTFPPIFFWGCKTAFGLFGVKWQSLVVLEAFVSQLGFLICNFLLLKITERKWLSGIGAAAIVVMTCSLFGFWWYDGVTDLIGCILLLTVAWRAKSQSILSLVVLVAVNTVLLYCKLNIGLGLTFLICLYFLTVKNVTECVAYLCSMFTIGTIVAASNRDMLGCCFSVCGRALQIGKSFDQLPPLEIVKNFGCPLLVLVLLVYHLTRTKRMSFLSFAAFSCYVIGFFTDGELKIVCCSFGVVGLLLLSHEALTYFAVGSLCWIAAMSALSRDRVLCAAWPYPIPQARFEQKFHGGLFDKLKVEGVAVSLLMQVDKAIRQYGTNAWFNTGLDYAYPLYSIAPPTNEFLYWWPGVSFAENKRADMLAEMLDHKHEFIYTFAWPFSQGDLEVVRQKYDEIPNTSGYCFMIFKLKR